jgi:60 kDa SS-A/Ro ribonucleoprotein
MARTNVATKPSPIFTAEGARAVKTSAEGNLRRTVMTCLLWEDAFYVDGQSVYERITQFAKAVKPETLAAIAVEARHEQNLRHVSLLLCSILATLHKGAIVSETIAKVVTRTDELAELLAIHAKQRGVGVDKLKKVMTHAMRKGLRKAFLKFDEYQLAKYNGDNAIKLRDVYFLVHPKPKSADQRALWERLVAGKLATPDTWEANLTAGADKKDTFERLLSEGKLGYLALLRNLRKMEQEKVDAKLIKEAITARKGAGRVLPFRFITAARHAPKFERELDLALIGALADIEKLPGKTVLIVDVSGSMGAMLSRKSELSRLDTAAALAAFVSGVSEEPVVYATAGSDGRRVHDTRLIPARQGMAMVDAIHKAARAQGGGGIFLTQCMEKVSEAEKDADRVIVITDEQDCDIGPLKKPEKANAFGKRNYLINISVEKNGIGYKPKWLHIDGWSENVIKFIAAHEASDN